MKSIHKGIKTKSIHVAFFVTACACLTAIIYASIIRPQLSHAESRYVTATITDDNGEVDFSPGINDAVANFSYVNNGSHTAASKLYNVKITLTDLPITSNQKKVSITLPVGMSWADDASGDQDLLSQLDTTKGTNGVEKIALDREPVLGYTFPNSGTRVYYFTEGSKAATINAKVKADNTINLGYIENAISIKAEIDNKIETSDIDVNVPSGASIGGQFPTPNPVNYVGAGSTFTINKDNIRSSRSNYVATSYYSVTRLITKIKFNFHVEGSATLQSATTDTQFSFDNSDAANGNYVITYTPNAATSGYFTIPYYVSFSEGANPGDIITITATGETSYWQPNGTELTIPHRNSQTAKYIILSNDEDVTTGWNSLDPENNGSAHDITLTSNIREGEGMTGVLGYGYINNRGNTDSVPKKAHLTFDTHVLGVMALRLACTPGEKIDSIHVKTTSGIEKDAPIDASCNSYGVSSAITYADLGIDRDDYIAEINYLIGTIPATTQLRSSTTNDGTRAFAYMGKRIDESQPGIATIEIFDADNPENTTGVASITSNISKNGGMNMSNSPTQVKSAGETLSFSFTTSAYGASSGLGYIYGTKSPIIYLRSEAKDASGNFLPITNIKVTNGPSRGNQDITNLFGQITVRDTETARLYILDGRNITNGLASISTNSISNDGKLSNNQLIVSFSINTSITTPSQSHDIKNMIFIQDPDDNSLTTNDISGDSFGISIIENGGMVGKATTNYYQIKQSASILTENSGKHTSSDTWLTWSEGQNPITIGAVENSKADMKISLINNSGVEITEPTTVYSPIPKEGQDWKSLSGDGQPFKFSTTLDGAISNPNNEHFVISYGKNVTPTDDGSILDGESSKFTSDTTGWTNSDWQEVNCVKITATNIPANLPDQIDTYEFIYRLKTTDTSSDSDGLINTWRPLFFQQLVNSANDTFAGWYKGSYVSLQLANGVVSGEIFIDANENGKKDTGEQNLQEAGWKIDLYDKISDKLVRSTETDTNGRYNIVELITNPDSYYMTVTNKHPLGSNDTTYLFTQKGDTSNANNYNTDNQAEGDRTSTPAHTTARIAPVSPSQTSGEAIYNIGVIGYEEKTTYSAHISFNDQNNETVRPTTITLTAIASDNSQQTITIDTSDNGERTIELPKYTNAGDRLTYSFSSPDLPNYDKSEQSTGNTYNLNYTQKTATLTVHHYIINSTTQLLPDNTSTVYWGQSYETSQGAVNTNYEFDSVAGEPSGTVSGDITITYYYKKKTGTVTTHYYTKDTNTPIANDKNEQYEYGEFYSTSPLAQLPAEFENYELVSEHPAGYTGQVNTPNTEVTYFYQKKDPQVQSTITITGPDTIDNKSSAVPYTINYSAHLIDYIGNAKINFTLQLPYPIIEDSSKLDGGIYNADNQTITWITETTHNSYQEENISLEYKIELAFDGANADSILTTTAQAFVEFDGKTNNAMETFQTFIRTPSTITFEYVDQDGNKIKETEQKEGYVGDEYSDGLPEITGYTLNNDNDINPVFTEENRIIVYRYTKKVTASEASNEENAPGTPDTSGSGDTKPSMSEANNANLTTLSICVFTSISISLSILYLSRLKKHKQ